MSEFALSPKPEFYTHGRYQLNIEICNDKYLEYYTNLVKQYHEGDSGLDLFSEAIHVKVFEVGTVDFGIRCEMIDTNTNLYTSYYLAPRSSISNTDFQMANSIGIIDAGYRGNIMAKVRAFGTADSVKELGQGRWFQIVAPDLKPLSINIVDKVSTTSRGTGGFGSTNKISKLFS